MKCFQHEQTTVFNVNNHFYSKTVGRIRSEPGKYLYVSWTLNIAPLCSILNIHCNFGTLEYLCLVTCTIFQEFSTSEGCTNICIPENFVGKVSIHFKHFSIVSFSSISSQSCSLLIFVGSEEELVDCEL